MWNSINCHGCWSGEIWNRNKNGELSPEWLSISTLHDEVGEIRNYIGVFTDISVLKQSEEKLEHLANHDPLTGLANRLLLNDRLESAIKRRGVAIFAEACFGHPSPSKRQILNATVYAYGAP
ncbi:hypothetical protein BOW53_15605, partial [Solemya pervernicosa gill symbiont]